MRGAIVLDGRQVGLITNPNSQLGSSLKPKTKVLHPMENWYTALYRSKR
ncbi:hypothetical protein [Moorena producens]